MAEQEGDEHQQATVLKTVPKRVQVEAKGGNHHQGRDPWTQNDRTVKFEEASSQ